MEVKLPFVKKAPYFTKKDEEGFSQAVVDMIFISPNLKVVEHHQPQVDASDHYPLVISLEV